VRVVANIIHEDGESLTEVMTEAAAQIDFVEVLDLDSEISDEFDGDEGVDWRENFCNETGMYLSNAVEVLDVQRDALGWALFEQEEEGLGAQDDVNEEYNTSEFDD
jgi:hypothetical protein